MTKTTSDEAPAAARPPSNPYYVLALFTVIYAFANLDRNFISLALTSIKHDLHASDTVMGLIVGFAFSGIQILVGVPLGRWADRGDRKLVIAVAVSFWSVMTMLGGMAQNLVQFALTRIGVGIGEATGPAYHSFLSDLFPKTQRGRVIAIYALGVSLSTLVGFPILGEVMQLWGWRTAYILAGAPGLLLVVVVILTVREPRRNAGHPAQTILPMRQVFRTLWRQKSYILLTLGFGIAGFGSAGFRAWGPAFLGRVHHLTHAQIGGAIGLIEGSAGLAGGILGGIAVDLCSKRWGDAWRVIPFAITATLVGPTVLMVAFTPYLPLALAGMGFLSFCSTFQFAPMISAVQTIMPPRMRAIGGSFNGFFGALVGIGAAPLYIGMFNDHMSHIWGDQTIRYSLASAAIFSLIGAGCYWLASRRVAENIQYAEHS